MKNKKNLPSLIKHFLKSSPRSKATRRNAIITPQYSINIAKLPSDEMFIRNFIVHVDCSYLYHYYGPSNLMENKITSSLRTKRSLMNVLEGVKTQKTMEINDKSLMKKTILFELIKGLNKDKQNILKYIELQELIQMMTETEIIENKKIIVYFYKWLLNEKHNMEEGSTEKQLCFETSEMIIKRIYEAHEQNRNGQSAQDHEEMFKNTEAELMVIERMEKARESHKQGDLEGAMNIYMEIYGEKLAQESDKKQALGYLCERSVEKSDKGCLESLLDKIRLSGSNREHESLVKRSLTQLKETVPSKTEGQTEESNTNAKKSSTEQKVISSDEIDGRRKEVSNEAKIEQS